MQAEQQQERSCHARCSEGGACRGGLTNGTRTASWHVEASATLSYSLGDGRGNWEMSEEWYAYRTFFWQQVTAPQPILLLRSEAVPKPIDTRAQRERELLQMDVPDGCACKI